MRCWLQNWGACYAFDSMLMLMNHLRADVPEPVAGVVTEPKKNVTGTADLCGGSFTRGV